MDVSEGYVRYYMHLLAGPSPMKCSGRGITLRCRRKGENKSVEVRCMLVSNVLEVAAILITALHASCRLKRLRRNAWPHATK